MKFNLIILLSFLSCVPTLQAQINKNCSFELKLNGKEYDQVRLEIALSGLEKHNVIGSSIDKQNWIFQYPDTVYKKHSGMKLYGKQNNDSIEYKFVVYMPLELDTLKYDSFTVGEESKLSASFIKSDIFEYQGKKFYTDDFLFSNKDDETMYLMAKALNEGFSLFWRDTLSYDQRISKYEKIVSLSPNSHHLMSALYGSIGRYKSKEDIARIFNNFSVENKNSYYGNKIKEYLNMNFFENSTLPDWQTNKLEPIIQDTKKYNLVIFSASWCGPCHKQIPNLKKIHNDLQEKLNMTYVSIDEPETVEEWKKLMKREQIPWRSLLAKDDVKGLQNKYYIHSIPMAFLVFPNWKIQRLQLYEEKDRKLIYAITSFK